VHLVGFHYKHLVDNLPFFFISFLFRPLRLQPTHFRYRGLLLHLVTLRHTHKHARAVELLWTSGRPAVEIQEHKKQTPAPPAVFELTIPANLRLQSYALDRAAPDIGVKDMCGL
jgi:hypothetical protein